MVSAQHVSHNGAILISTKTRSVFTSVRMAEWSKAPDSRLSLVPWSGIATEISGPLMRAWVRIPLLTTNLLHMIWRKTSGFLKIQNPSNHLTFLFAGSIYVEQRLGRTVCLQDSSTQVLMTIYKDVIFSLSYFWAGLASFFQSVGAAAEGCAEESWWRAEVSRLRSAVGSASVS